MMYDVKNIKLYLRKNDVSKVELMGVMGIIIISKDVIKRHTDVGEFIEYVMKIKFPEYVIKSRTLRSARINRILINIEDNSEIRKISRNILDYLDNIENENKSNEPEKNIKTVKKENENDKLKKWLKGLWHA